VMTLLVDGGSDVNAVGEDGQTPTELGFALRSIPAVRLLIEKGAKLPDFAESSDYLSGMVRDIRQDMLLLQPSEQGDHIAVMYELYDRFKSFPAEPPINQFEAKKIYAEPSGVGGFGECWEGMFLGRYRIAMKRPRPNIRENQAIRVRRRLEREVEAWKGLNHPHVVQFIGLCSMGTTVYMLSPWMENGNMSSFLQKQPSPNCAKLALQIAEGLQYLHTREPTIVHGNLKGTNVLITSSGDAVIADFGLSDMLVDATEPNDTRSWHAVGAWRWQAPELANAVTPEQATRTIASDIFALGRVLIEVFTFRVPFPEIRNEVELAKRAAAGELPKRPTDHNIIARGLDKRMWRLIADCCRFRPPTRPNVDEVVRRLQPDTARPGNGSPLVSVYRRLLTLLDSR